MIIPGDNPDYSKTTGLPAGGRIAVSVWRACARHRASRVAPRRRADRRRAQVFENRERVVSRNDLLASVWGGRIVADATLDSRIAAARRAIGDSGVGQTLIRTFARKGVRFVGEVQKEAKPAALGPEMAAEPGIAAIPGGARQPPRLSIVVLPFTNLSSDPDQEYFADGITDDLTTDLSRISGSFVIARSSAFTYEGKAVEARQVGRELGVRYVLEGSVRRSGGQIRLNAQLIDAETDAHLWAERFDPVTSAICLFCKTRSPAGSRTRSASS
jgi:TolB-like protein